MFSNISKLCQNVSNFFKCFKRFIFFNYFSNIFKFFIKIIMNCKIMALHIYIYRWFYFPRINSTMSGISCPASCFKNNVCPACVFAKVTSLLADEFRLSCISYGRLNIVHWFDQFENPLQCFRCRRDCPHCWIHSFRTPLLKNARYHNCD